MKPHLSVGEYMKRSVFQIAILVLVVGCATEPRWNGPIVHRSSDGSAYVRANWATMGVDEASEKCYAEIAANPLVSHYICMKGKGYQEQ